MLGKIIKTAKTINEKENLKESVKGYVSEQVKEQVESVKFMWKLYLIGGIAIIFLIVAILGAIAFKLIAG